MRVDVAAGGSATLVWITDLLPHELAETLAAAYDTMFVDLLVGVEASAGS